MFQAQRLGFFFFVFLFPARQTFASLQSTECVRVCHRLVENVWHIPHTQKRMYVDFAVCLVLNGKVCEFWFGQNYQHWEFTDKQTNPNAFFLFWFFNFRLYKKWIDVVFVLVMSYRCVFSGVFFFLFCFLTISYCESRIVCTNEVTLTVTECWYMTKVLNVCRHSILGA